MQIRSRVWSCCAVAVLTACGASDVGSDRGVANGTATAPVGSAESTTNEGLAGAVGDRTWTPLFQADSSTPEHIGGTELRSLVAFDGKLFAGNGYWMDTEASPGAQIFQLDSAKGAWSVSALFADRAPNPKNPDVQIRKYLGVSTVNAVTVTTDGAGALLAVPQPFLLAGLWSAASAVDVVARKPNSAWSMTTIANDAGNVRSFATHVDSVTGVSTVFGGASAQDKEGAGPPAIMVATLDRVSRDLVWAPDPEPFVLASLPGAPTEPPAPGERVMGIAEANGHLYATVGASLYERIDGPSPSWRWCQTVALPAENNVTASGGLRGLHAVAAPGGREDLLVATGGLGAATMVRFDLQHGAPVAAVVETDVFALLHDRWSAELGEDTPVTRALLAYNDMLDVRDPATGEAVTLIGLEATLTADQHPGSFALWHRFVSQAHYLVRRADGQYEVHAIAEGTTVQAARVSVRAMTLSPFDPNTVFAGGFDANAIGVHDSAWALQAPLSAVLE